MDANQIPAFCLFPKTNEKVLDEDSYENILQLQREVSKAYSESCRSHSQNIGADIQGNSCCESSDDESSYSSSDEGIYSCSDIDRLTEFAKKQVDKLWVEEEMYYKESCSQCRDRDDEKPTEEKERRAVKKLSKKSENFTPS